MKRRGFFGVLAAAPAVAAVPKAAPAAVVTKAPAVITSASCSYPNPRDYEYFDDYVNARIDADIRRVLARR